MPYKDILKFDLESGIACTGGPSLNFGSLIYADEHRREIDHSYKLLDLGLYRDDFTDPAALVRFALQLENEQNGVEVSPEDVIAYVGLRLCSKVRHVEPRPPEKRHSGNTRLERQATIGVVHHTERRESFRPLTSRELTASETAVLGLTRARRQAVRGTVNADVVLAPLTAVEQKPFHNVFLDGIQVGPVFRNPARQPSMLLHRTERGLLEDIILLEQIEEA